MGYLNDVTNVTNREVNSFAEMVLLGDVVIGQQASLPNGAIFTYTQSGWNEITNIGAYDVAVLKHEKHEDNTQSNIWIFFEAVGNTYVTQYYMRADGVSQLRTIQVGTSYTDCSFDDATIGINTVYLWESDANGNPLDDGDKLISELNFNYDDDDFAGYIHYNKVDLKGFTNLKVLDMFYNRSSDFVDLNISDNVNLEKLLLNQCDRIGLVDMTGLSNLTDIVVNNCPTVTDIIYDDDTSKLKSLIVSNAPNISKVIPLTASKFPLLEEFRYRVTSVNRVYCEGLPNIISLSSSGNKNQDTVHVKNCPLLTEVSVSGLLDTNPTQAPLTSCEFENIPLLETLSMGSNNIQTDISLSDINPTNDVEVRLSHTINASRVTWDTTFLIEELDLIESDITEIVSPSPMKKLSASRCSQLHNVDASSNTTYPINGILLEHVPMTGAELDAFFNTLIPTTQYCSIYIRYSAGVADCDITIATNKGYTVHT